jgi:hypothetical protein
VPAEEGMGVAVEAVVARPYNGVRGEVVEQQRVHGLLWRPKWRPAHPTTTTSLHTFVWAVLLQHSECDTVSSRGGGGKGGAGCGHPPGSAQCRCMV